MVDIEFVIPLTPLRKGTSRVLFAIHAVPPNKFKYRIT
jgi:hypothetical protein